MIVSTFILQQGEWVHHMFWFEFEVDIREWLKLMMERGEYVRLMCYAEGPDPYPNRK